MQPLKPCSRVVSGTIALTFLSLQQLITPEGTFYLFAMIAILGVLFTYHFVPETKGRSLETIESELSAMGSFGCCSCISAGSAADSSGDRELDRLVVEAADEQENFTEPRAQNI